MVDRLYPWSVADRRGPRCTCENILAPATFATYYPVVGVPASQLASRAWLARYLAIKERDLCAYAAYATHEGHAVSHGPWPSICATRVRWVREDAVSWHTWCVSSSSVTRRHSGLTHWLNAVFRPGIQAVHAIFGGSRAKRKHMAHAACHAARPVVVDLRQVNNGRRAEKLALPQNAEEVAKGDHSEQRLNGSMLKYWGEYLCMNYSICIVNNMHWICMYAMLYYMAHCWARSSASCLGLDLGPLLVPQNVSSVMMSHHGWSCDGCLSFDSQYHDDAVFEILRCIHYVLISAVLFLFCTTTPPGPWLAHSSLYRSTDWPTVLLSQSLRDGLQNECHSMACCTCDDAMTTCIIHTVV